ncbi:hypothetical protein NQ314_002683 [Rhamnusium bicolor]|uniref:Sperm-associated antigen 1 n=1 Tax=Rhamnusium bicolor TaxID=1586634 RepID=A0AAV8ZPG0_9CUCU|nr:hypothetical protein NQ314_002683 [Rhamnusium bicolor]
MSGLDNLSHLTEPEECYHQGKQTLLSKYEIPIQHFDFDYIEKCSNGKELEKILHVLRSGEEGHYPDLIKTAEEQLKTIKPKSKFLRKIGPVINKDDLSKDEVSQLSKDLEHWVSNISKHNNELESRKTNTIKCDEEVRRYKEMQNETALANPNEKRISSTDYKAWDKYDPDTELLKMELAEEREKKVVTEENKSSKNKPKKSVTFNKFATEAEAAFISEREKEKGNEFFKAGDYEDALSCYTASISSKPCVNNLNNRAVTYLKLKKYEMALKDCDKVLTIERDNLKAHLRKAESFEKLKRFEEALECVDFVIQRDPNNCIAQEVADRVRKYCGNSLKNTRMKIIEIE